MLRAIVREMPDGSVCSVYPFHMSLEGLKKAIICRDDEDYDVLIKYIFLCAISKNVRVITYVVVSNHLHVILLAENEAQAKAYGNEIRRRYAMWFSHKYHERRLYHKKCVDVQWIDTDWYLRNAIAYVFRNALDNGDSVESYPWSGYRALFCKGRCGVWARPVSSLTKRESEELYRIVDQLREEGVSVIFISHRFEDMYRLASRVTVFRDSQYIGTYNVDEITNADLIKAMVGREISDLFPKPEVKIGKEMLKVEGLSRTGFFKDASFTVHAGEILGFTGLVGAGRTEVIESVCGITKPDAGKVYLEGREIHVKKPKDAMDLGIVLLPEDRQKEGLLMSWGLGRNVTLPIMGKFAKGGLNDEKKEREISKQLLEDVDTKAVDIFQPASSLSGGNQQKVVVAKALGQEMKVVIMDEPTKGVDVGAKAEIYSIMGDLAKQGYAIILISSEMPEILGMADRIVVMCNGRITGILNRDEATQEKILDLAMEKGATTKGGAA